jgi:hypothetical protein
VASIALYLLTASRADFRHQPANAGKVVIPWEMWPLRNDRQVSSDIEVHSETETRNLIRRQAGLPLVEPSRELERIRQVREEAAFERWMQLPLRYRVEQKLLQRMRRRMNNPSWTPTGMLSGGGWAFHAMLVKQMRKLGARLGEPALM